MELTAIDIKQLKEKLSESEDEIINLIKKSKKDNIGLALAIVACIRMVRYYYRNELKDLYADLYSLEVWVDKYNDRFGLKFDLVAKINNEVMAHKPKITEFMGWFESVWSEDTGIFDI